MSDDATAVPEEALVSPDPVKWARRAVRRVWIPVAVLAIFLIVLGIIFQHSLSWGDIPTWVLAITTLLAFLAAAFAGLVAYELLSVENARDKAASVERSLAAADRRRSEAERDAQLAAARRSQASKVTAWFEHYKIGEFPQARGSVSLMTWGAVINNASELPIFDVRVFFYKVNDLGGGSQWTPDLRYSPPERFRVIPPNHIRHFELPQTVLNTGEEANDDVWVVGIEFTDSSGVRWMRDARGALLDPNGSA